MQIHLSTSASTSLTKNKAVGEARDLTAAEVTAVAELMLPRLRRKIQGVISDRSLALEAGKVVANWANSARTPDFGVKTRQKAARKITTKLLSLYSKKPVAKKAMGPTPGTVVLGKTSAPKSRAELMTDKQKSVLKVANKLRDRFAGFLTKPPAMTAKGIIGLRAQCAAFQKVINSVEKGNEGLAEATKIEGLRGLPALKNYVNSVLGLSYGYHELVRMLGVSQSILGEKIREEIDIESMTKVMQKQRAKENAQSNLSYAVKALQRRGCMLPPAFIREVEKVFVDGVQDGDYKAAKARIKELLDGLVSDVFNNKVKLFQIK